MKFEFNDAGKNDAASLLTSEDGVNFSYSSSEEGRAFLTSRKKLIDLNIEEKEAGMWMIGIRNIIKSFMFGGVVCCLILIFLFPKALGLSDKVCEKVFFNINSIIGIFMGIVLSISVDAILSNKNNVWRHIRVTLRKLNRRQ